MIVVVLALSCAKIRAICAGSVTPALTTKLWTTGGVETSPCSHLSLTNDKSRYLGAF